MTVGYGKRVRETVRRAINKKNTKYKCPSCSRNSVRRLSHGVWQCRKCNSKYASGSYEFSVGI